MKKKPPPLPPPLTSKQNPEITKEKCSLIAGAEGKSVLHGEDGWVLAEAATGRSQESFIPDTDRDLTL